MSNTNTELKIHFFLDDKEIMPSELSKITISNITVNRIINETVERISSGISRNVNQTG